MLTSLFLLPFYCARGAGVLGDGAALKKVGTVKVKKEASKKDAVNRGFNT